MKHLVLLTATLFPMIVDAQLTNGSFEENGAPSLAGWEWTCNPPGQPNEGAPGSGAWCANKGPGETQGCFPSYIYQRLPDVVDGAMTTLSGWIRCSDEEPCMGGFIGIWTMNNGVITPGAMVGSQLPVWSYVYINQIIELGPGDTAVAVLNGGMIGGPIAASPSYFDGLVLNTTLSVDDARRVSIVSRFDPATNTLFISSGAATILGAQLFDATGRLLDASLPIHGGSNTRVEFDELHAGAYIATLSTADALRSVRFIVP